MYYADLDYSGNWEYKTVHSRNGEFGNPYHLQRLIREEAHAGWAMIEQFDTSSVRFRREVMARQRDHLLPRGVDPYRTLYTYTAATETEMFSALFLAALVFIMVSSMIGLVILFSLP